MTWDKQYRRGRRVSEREFHDDLQERLVADPDLGGRVERGRPWRSGTWTPATTGSLPSSRSNGRPR